MTAEEIQKNKNGLTAQLLRVYPKIFSAFNEGDILEGELIKKTGREAYFDLDKYGTGVVSGRELFNARDVLKNAQPGEKFFVKVINSENEEGYIEVSLAEASRQKVWQQIKELQENNEVVKVKIVGANSGGLIANLFDIKAFLPIAQLSNEHYPKITETEESIGDRQKIIEALKKFVGEEFSVKILNINPRQNKVILSEREIFTENLRELISRYQINQEVDVLVSGIADFGVFVRFADNPQIEGLIHISELGHRLIDNPKEVVKIGETLRVKIIDIRENRISLSLKALRADPWETVQERYKIGQEVRGLVYKLYPFGAVIDLEGSLQGIIHVAEFGSVEEMKKALVVGQEYDFSIVDIRPQEKRLILKLEP